MKEKILIILIALICLGGGGFFVYKNISVSEFGEKAPVVGEELEEIPQEEITPEEIEKVPLGNYGARN